MDWLFVGARLVLFAVFAVAGVAKLLDPDGTRRSLADFHFPQRLVRPVAWLLPVVEIAAAAGLLITPAARSAAVLVLLLLAAFALALGRALARGERPACHCFGQVHAEPISRMTLARNAGLAGLAVLVVADADPVGLPGWLAGRETAELIALVLAGLLLAAMAEIRRLRRRLGAGTASAAIEPLPVGAPAPPFVATDPGGNRLTEADLVAEGTGAVLVFISPRCPACVELLPELSSWQRSLARDLRIVVVHAGADRALTDLLERHPLSPLVLDPESEILRSYRAAATPSALTIDPEGRVSSRPVAGPVAVETLVRSALHGTL